ncbi:MAG: hypothetical protein HGA23_00035 [Bacteroidales bacterium]|nr:hypothetical protein [Bacteroidales bacterium]
MKMGFKHITLLLLLAFSVGAASGQYTGATAKLEKDAIRIGDQIRMELTVTVPAGSRLQWPMLLDTLARNIEILRKSGIDTVSSDKEQFTLKQELIITSFDSGTYVIRPILFKYNRTGDTLTFFTETMPLTLDVQTIQTDAAQDIKPIKPPLKAPVTFREMLPWIGLVLLILIIAALVYYYYKKKKLQPPVVATRLNTTIPPYEAAIEALDSLRLKKLWQSGRTKEYYSELTEIVREYIELRFPVRAMEMTTSEINAALRQTEVSATSREKLNQVLILADLVKFAKEQPLPLENEQSMIQCVDFVRETKPGKGPEAGPAQQNDNVEQQIVK